VSWPPTLLWLVAKQIFEAFDSQVVLISNFFFQEVGHLFPRFVLLRRCQIDHHAIGLHHAINGRLHLSSPSSR
jgi:hypothetical protein